MLLLLQDSDQGLINVEIWWQGIRGMVIEQIKKQIVTMLQYEDPPNYIFLHVSANNIGHKLLHVNYKSHN
jgi:hypothetical protein